MTPVLSDKREIRRIQGLILLLSCLPNDGKCREVLELALALDHRPTVQRLHAPVAANDERGHQPWLESLWARADLSADERKIVEWQNRAENMEPAVGELRAIEEKLPDIWFLE